VPVQLRLSSGQTGDEYVTRALWCQATLACCPIHGAGARCGFARHGTYQRRTPPGTRIARWYCPQGHRTFSLLPEHLAARLAGTLAELERVVEVVEASRSMEAAADTLRPDPIGLAGALRWVRRRVTAVHRVLAVAITLLPLVLTGCPPRLGAVRQRLGCATVLVDLRQRLGAHLQALIAPLGFRHRGGAARAPRAAHQHKVGPDPPGGQP